MNSIQRAWRSTIRKPVKSVLLLMVIITVSLFVLCGMACRNASVQTQDTTRQAVGAGLRLEINQANRTEALFEYSEMIPEGEDGRFGQTTLLKVCTKMILRELLQRQESLITI